MLEFTVGVLGKTMNAEVMKTEEYDLEKRPLELAEHIGRTESMEDEDSDLRLPTPAKRRAVIKNPPVRSSAFSVQRSVFRRSRPQFSVQRSVFSVQRSGEAGSASIRTAASNRPKTAAPATKPR